MLRYGPGLCLLTVILAGCAEPGGPRSMSSDCAALKRQQHAMVAEGKQNTDAYRRILDAYLSRCHR